MIPLDDIDTIHNKHILNNIAQRAETYKPKPRTTYKMINEYIDEKYSFKVHSAYIAEVKRSLGLPMYNAPNAVEIWFFVNQGGQKVTLSTMKYVSE